MKGPLEYQNEIKQLHFTEQQKQQLIRQLNKAPEQQTVKRSPRMTRTLLAAAVLCAALTITVGAAGGLESAAEAFRNLFELDPVKTEIVNKIGRPVGASDTHDGLTVTADAIMGDRYNVCIVYTLSNEDGTPLDALQNGEKLRLSFGMPGAMGAFEGRLGGSQGGHGNCEFRDFVPGDGKIQYVEYLSANEEMDPEKEKITVHFKNLYMQVQDEWTVLKKGDWKLKLALCYEDLSMELAQNEKKDFAWEDVCGSVKTLQISPLGIYMEYETDLALNVQIAELSEEEKQQLYSRMGQQYQVPVQIKKRDGTVLRQQDLMLGGSLVPDGEKTVCIRSGQFDEILPLEEIESVSIGDAVYLMP